MSDIPLMAGDLLTFTGDDWPSGNRRVYKVLKVNADGSVQTELLDEDADLLSEN